MLKDTTGTSIGKLGNRVLELCFQVEKRRGGCEIPSHLVRSIMKINWLFISVWGLLITFSIVIWYMVVKALVYLF